MIVKNVLHEKIAPGQRLRPGDSVKFNEQGELVRCAAGERGTPLPSNFRLVEDGRLEVPAWWSRLISRAP